MDEPRLTLPELKHLFSMLNGAHLEAKTRIALTQKVMDKIIAREQSLSV